MSHTRISPSKLARIIACPGSLQLAEQLAGQLPPEPTAAADEGTKLHALAEEALANANIDGPFEHSDPLVHWAVNQVLDVARENRGVISTECRVHMGNGVSGTTDAVLYSSNSVHIFDYKFGSWPVKAEENPQLLAYAYGALRDMRSATQQTKVILHIIQPRLQVHDIFECTYGHVCDFWWNSAVPAIQNALSSDWEKYLNPSTETCKWCRAMPLCQPRHDWANKTARDVFSALKSDSPVVSDDELFELYKRAEGLKEHIAAVEALVRSKLSSGPSHGFKLVRTRGRREWKFDAENTLEKAVDIIEQHGIDPFESKIRTAPSVLRECPALKKALAPFIVSAPGKTLAIVSDNDPRDSVNENPFAGLELQ